MTLCGKRVFVDDQGKMRSLGQALVQYDHVFIKRGNLYPDKHTKETPREDEGRDWGDAPTGQGTPKIVSKALEAGGEPGTDSPLGLGGTHPAHTLTWDSWPPG